MKQVKKFFAVSALVYLFVCGAHAQQRPAPQNNKDSAAPVDADAKAKSSSSSSLDLTLVQPSGGGNRVEALPGPAVAGPIGGPAFLGQGWDFVEDPLANPNGLSTEAMRDIQKPKGKVLCRLTVAKKELPAKNDQPFQLVKYNPLVTHLAPPLDPDRRLGVCSMIGDFREMDETYYTAIQREAKHFIPGSTRGVLYARHLKKTVNREKMFGAGFAISSDSKPVGGSAGLGLGSLSTLVEDPIQIEVVILNNGGPIDSPAPAPKQEVPSPPEKQPGAKAESSTEQPQVSVASVDVCEGYESIEDTKGYFAWNDSAILDSFPVDPRPGAGTFISNNREALLAQADWLNHHTICRVQIVGTACFLGSDEWNANLSKERAMHWRDALLPLLTAAAQKAIVQYAPLGKQLAKQAYEPLDRSAYLQVVRVVN